MEKEVPRDDLLVRFIEILNNAPVNKDNIDLMMKIRNQQNKASESTPEHAEYVSFLDSILLSYFEIMEEDKTRVKAISNPNTDHETEAIPNSIYKVLKGADQHIRSIIRRDLNTEYSGLRHSSIQLRAGPPRMMSKIPIINLPSPYIPHFAVHHGTIEVKYSFDSIQESKERVTPVTWAFAFEMFKEPEEGFYCSNVVLLRLLKEEQVGGSQIFAPAAPDSTDNYVQIRFPLRVQPPQEELYQHLKCAQFMHDENANKLTVKTRKKIKIL